MAAETIKQISQGGVVRDIEDATARTLIQSLQNALDFLTNGDTTSAIESFNEIISFLENIEDSSTLSGIIASIQTSIGGKVDKVTGKGLSTNDFTDELLTKLNGLSNYNDTALQTAVSNLQTALQNIYTKSQTYNKDEADAAIAQAEATIEQSQLTVITGDKLSMWLDEDGESINIMAGEVPDIAAAPTISHVINNDGTATVTIVNNEQGATIYYTTNGDTPTESSSVYSSALTFDTVGSYTIKTIAVVQDKMKSSVATDSFSVVSCQTPVIAVDNSARNTATVTATAGTGESVTLTVGGQTATGTGSASVTINKGSEPQTLTAVATATAAGKLSATKTDNNVRIEEKVAYVFGAHELGGKAVAGTTQGDIQITLNSSFANQAATITEEDGVIWWKIDCANQVYLGTTLQNEVDRSSSIFSAGAAKILTIEHLPDECTTINNANVFAGCTALEQFKVGSSNLSTFTNPLAGNTSLEVVVLPSTVTSLNGSFVGCTALTSITAPAVVSLIGAVFNGCTALNELSIGHVTSIPNNAFLSCQELTAVDLSAVTTIGSQAFQDCKKLEDITMPSELTDIGNSAFKNTYKLTEITIPATITTIGNNAFQFSGVESFTVLKTTPPSLGTNVFGKWADQAPMTVYVPNGSVSAYQAATNWSDLTIEAIPNT